MAPNEDGFLSEMVGDNHDLVLRFVVAYSRFEYAVKRCGHLRQNERAEACWDTFANSIRGRFGGIDGTLREACDYLRQRPPRTQIVAGADLGWRATTPGPGESLERYVLRLVGKFATTCSMAASTQTGRSRMMHGT